MLPDIYRNERRSLNRRLFPSLFYATEVVDTVAKMYEDVDPHRWQRHLLGHTFSVSTPVESSLEGRKTALQAFGSWLRAHEEAQVMLASILVVVGMWWLVRTLLSLVINLICPLMVVVMAVVCVPQLREPLMGQNYPALANLLKSILLKLAENIKTS
ncbi:uncharacterized protein isoform X2 [Choristoneura fumiferana]|uniref:uncharacterized protein isoform X2 n=1 Tax=Choristoneura fumiferana TaxID=7141 RepID=UPI003D15C5CC